MIILTNNENSSYEKQTKCHIRQKGFCYDKNEEKKSKLYKKLEIIFVIQENLEELLIAFVI